MSKMPEVARCNNQAANRIPPAANGCVAYRFERLVTTSLLKQYAFTTSASI